MSNRPLPPVAPPGASPPTAPLPTRIGIGADHGGFALKEVVVPLLRAAGYVVTDFGANVLAVDDDYPDFILPLAHAVAAGTLERGIAICGSGVGACVAANKVPGVRAGVLHDPFSAHQAVEDDQVTIMCLGGRVVGTSLAWELIQRFLEARFNGESRHLRRLAKVDQLAAPAIVPPLRT